MESVSCRTPWSVCLTSCQVKHNDPIQPYITSIVLVAYQCTAYGTNVAFGKSCGSRRMHNISPVTGAVNQGACAVQVNGISVFEEV